MRCPWIGAATTATPVRKSPWHGAHKQNQNVDHVNRVYNESGTSDSAEVKFAGSHILDGATTWWGQCKLLTLRSSRCAGY